MHHIRRKSGHGSANSSTTDVRKAVTVTDPQSRHRTSRPSTMTRKVTPQVGYRLGKNPRDRERELDDEYRLSIEAAFPQYCMSCEKQFVPQDGRGLYCSEECRARDQESSSASLTLGSHAHRASHGGNYPFYSAGNPEPRDIIPRASPSRPSSMHFSPPTTPGMSTASHTSAISALRSLTIRPSSPPSPSDTYQTSIWPFSTRSAATSPSTSYSRPASTIYSSTYDSYYNPSGYSSGYSAGYTMASPSADRPLPSRKPGAYSRPKSIELVTPFGR